MTLWQCGANPPSAIVEGARLDLSGNAEEGELMLRRNMSRLVPISGTWTLTGSSGCAGSGSFTMTKM